MGGVTTVSRITGAARSTIDSGLAELRGDAAPAAAPERVRRKGGGRRALVGTDPSLLGDLKELVEPTTRGDPMAPLLWTAESLRTLAAGVRALGHRICHNVVGDLLREMGYSLQANRKTLEGTSRSRDAQFGYLNARVKEALAAGEPTISVDTKKKELVGDFKNGGRAYRPKGQPEPVRVHDFLIPELGRAAHGVYDIADNAGWVSLGIDHDTASFAVNAIRRWWQAMGRARYPQATRLLITADCGGSNGAGPAVEARVASPGQRTRHPHHGLSSPARHQQMEQDRASPVLVHHAKLARSAARQLSDHRPTDCHHHRCRSEGAVRDRPQYLSRRRQSHRCRDGRHQHSAPRISRRFELYHQPATACPKR